MTGSREGQVGRIPTARFRQLGPINWVIAKLARAPGPGAGDAPVHNAWSASTPVLGVGGLWHATVGGRLPRVDTELVILRVAHLRTCEYELQHHRRMARAAGLDRGIQAAIFSWPDVYRRTPAEELSARQRTLLQATDEFIKDRTISGGYLAAARELPGSAPADRILSAGKPIRRAGRDDHRPRHPAGQPAVDPSEEDIGQHGQRQYHRQHRQAERERRPCPLAAPAQRPAPHAGAYRQHTGEQNTIRLHWLTVVMASPME